jgi:hypothetical protein
MLMNVRGPQQEYKGRSRSRTFECLLPPSLPTFTHRTHRQVEVPELAVKTYHVDIVRTAFSFKLPSLRDHTFLNLAHTFRYYHKP